ncbi:MAG: hypothetical protein BWK78_09990 [Thiotrichaceae bacterium IS1]|nr:MAG: hypothetical protein BWK78_09990 [Thiotrichaceae bacterium IS1]
MQVISIASNDESIFIHIDKKVCDAYQLNQLLEFVKLNFVDFSPVPEVSDEEQQELSAWLDAIPASEREIAFSRVLEL